MAEQKLSTDLKRRKQLKSLTERISQLYIISTNLKNNMNAFNGSELTNYEPDMKTESKLKAIEETIKEAQNLISYYQQNNTNQNNLQYFTNSNESNIDYNLINYNPNLNVEPTYYNV